MLGFSPSRAEAADGSEAAVIEKAEAQAELSTEVSVPVSVPVSVQVPSELSRPYTVDLPGGWDVSELKAPRPKSGRDLLGGRLRAIKQDNGAVAVIEITHMPKPATGEQPDLAYEFGKFIESIKSEYQNQALEVTTGDAKPSTFSSLPSEEVEITVIGKNQQLRQWFAMAIGKDYVFALSFTAQKEFFDKLRPEFEKCRQSIVIK